MLRTLTERSRFAETQASLDEAKAAILAFAAANGRLPCPADVAQLGVDDNQNFGVEHRAKYPSGDPSCSGADRRGLVPWKTLGIQGADAWGQYLNYETTTNMSQMRPSSALELGTVEVFASRTEANPSVAADAVAFAIWSSGENGHEAFNTQNGLQSPSADSDERSNAASNPPLPLRVIVRAHSDTFDDQGLWVSRFVVFKQMLDAGWPVIPSTTSSSPSSSGGG